MVCYTDNGPQFVSREYSHFSEEYGVKHAMSSPYYPKENGIGEAAGKMTEFLLRKALQKDTSARTDLLTRPVHVLKVN